MSSEVFPEEFTPPRISLAFSVVLGGLMSLGSAVPAAFVTAMFYRFPVVMAGYVSIPEFIGSHGLWETLRFIPGLMIALVFTVALIGIRGWFVILSILGGIGGWMVYRSGAVDYRSSIRWNAAVACLTGLIFALVTANLGIL